MALPVYTDGWSAIEAIQQAFNTYWLTQPIITHMEWDNTPLEAVNPDVDLSITSTDADVEGEAVGLFHVVHGGGGIAALGTKLHRQVGVCRVEIYAEQNRGRRRGAGKIADQALNFFQTQEVAGVTFQEQRTNEVGPSGRWWQVNVLADVIYDIHRS